VGAVRPSLAPMTTLPPVDSLRCFLAVAEHLSFRRASSELALTPGAVSQRIRQLEGLVDAQLFERSSRRVQLTAAGRELLPRARQAIAAVRACVTLDDAAVRPIRASVGTRFELGLSWLVPAVLALRDERPHWTLDLVFGSGGEILERLEAGTVDCIITSAPTANERWVARVLHDETYALVAAPSRLAERGVHRAEDVSAHSLLDIDRSLPLARYAQSASPDLSFADVVCCGTGAAVHAMVRAGAGIAVLPEYMVRGDLEAGVLSRVLPDLPLLRDTFRLLYRADSSLADMFDGLAAWLAERPLS